MFDEFLKKDCPLCARLKKGSADLEYLQEEENLLVFRGPFRDRWPGALMLVYKRHVIEQSEIRAIDYPLVTSAIVDMERAIRRICRPRRMNVVKFGNECEHLHWHLIPRYTDEAFPEKTPWELLSKPVSEIYKSGRSPLSEPEDFLYATILEASVERRRKRSPPYFATALFLRPTDPTQRGKCDGMSAGELVALARQEPDRWECLLMKRNYLDFSWDSIGGGADSGEFPEQTLHREVREELGWKLKSCVEVTRQWVGSHLRGFVFVAVPTEKTWLDDSPYRVRTPEVAGVQYFPLMQLKEDESFPRKVRDRVRALLNGDIDFSIDNISGEVLD